MNKQVDLTTAGMQIQEAAGPGYSSTPLGSSLLQSRENSKALSAEQHNQVTMRTGNQVTNAPFSALPLACMVTKRPRLLLLLPQISPFLGYRLCRGGTASLQISRVPITAVSLKDRIKRRRKLPLNLNSPVDTALSQLSFQRSDFLQ